ncbi:MAG: TonB-dependent receptor [Spirosomataceae bacterium]
MKTFKGTWLTLLLLMTTLKVTGQHILAGRVTDAKTGEAVPYAAVFINNTAKATETDEWGRYRLKYGAAPHPGANFELVVSALGYVTFRKTIEFSKNDTLFWEVLLDPSPQTINEVAVKGKRDPMWLKQYKKFEKAFVGTGENARSVKILNPWVLDFEGDATEFSAAAPTPLEVENKALGYKVFFELQRFTVSTIRSNFAGLARFEIMKAADEKQQKNWEENRRYAYEGSERHFLKALAQKRLKSEGFAVYEVNPSYHEKTTFSHLSPQLGKRLFPLNDTAVVRMGKFPLSREIVLRNEIEVLHINHISRIDTYQDAPFPVSWLRIKGGKTEVTTSGLLFNADANEWAGDIAERRIADLLPLDYEPDPLPENDNWRLFLPKNTPESPVLSALEVVPLPLVSVKHAFAGDTAVFRIQVKQPDGSPASGRLSVAVIEDASPVSPRPDTLVASGSSADTSRINVDKKAIMLEEVKIKVKQSKKSTHTLLGKIDYVVESKDLKDIISGNVMTALQHKVPGLDIFETTDNAGFSRKGIRIRGGGYSLRATGSADDEPLFLLDGIPFGTLQNFNALPVSEVERIEVIKSANSLLGARGKNGAINVVTKRVSANRGAAPSVAMNEGKLFFWQPAVILSPQGEAVIRFVLPKGVYYYVTVNGLTADNQPFTHEMRVY